jgi:CheY-like chemotaxis protein
MTNILSDKHILVVEDDVVSSEFLYESLKMQGAEVTHVNTGENAVKLLENGAKFDLVLMDICLPGMDGYETMNLLHQIDPAIPVIAQTAYITDNHEHYALRVGCVDFIAKPIKPDNLFQLITKHV